MESPYGTPARAPDGFAPPERWPEYAQITDPVDICAREGVGANPAGVRWSLWPFTFEEYYGDQEPDMAAARTGALARNRIVTWKRVQRTDAPAGWRAFSQKTWRIDGAAPLAAGEDYTARWHKNARRDLRLFAEARASGRCSVEQVNFDDYAAAYRQSLIAARAGTFRLHDLGKKLAHPLTRDNTELLAVRDQSGALVAGSAVIYSPTHRLSTHVAPFMTEGARELYAATGLVDYWFAETARRGYRYAVTTSFWMPGKPKSWKGFSEFKSHFGYAFVEYPPILYRFVRGALW